MIKKPEKIIPYDDRPISPSQNDYMQGNQETHDNWRAYHVQEMDKKDEIIKLYKDLACDFLHNGIDGYRTKMTKEMDDAVKLEKAIYDMKGEQYGTNRSNNNSSSNRNSDK